MGRAKTLLAGILIGMIVGAALYNFAVTTFGPSPTETTTTTTATVATVTVESTVYPPNPATVQVYGEVTTSALGTYPTKLSIRDSQGQSILNFTLGGKDTYNATLRNGALYYFHVYYSFELTGGGDKNCATVFLNVGYGSAPVRLDLKC